MYNLRRLHFAILSFCPAVGFRLGLAQTKLSLLPFSHYNCSKRKQKLSLPFHHHIQNKTQQQHIRWKLSLPLAVQDISRTFLAIAGIFVSYSGHVKDEEGKKPDINGRPATPHKQQKLSKLGNYSLNIFPFFYGFLGNLSKTFQRNSSIKGVPPPPRLNGKSV